MEKIFANHITCKGLIYKMYKKFKQLNEKEINIPTKMVKLPEQTLFQRRYTRLARYLRDAHITLCQGGANQCYNEMSPQNKYQNK